MEDRLEADALLAAEAFLAAEALRAADALCLLILDITASMLAA